MDTKFDVSEVKIRRIANGYVVCWVEDKEDLVFPIHVEYYCDNLIDVKDKLIELFI